MDKPFLFLGHRDAVIGCFLGYDNETNDVDKVYTIARDGYIFSWNYGGNDGEFSNGDEQDSEPPSPETPEREGEGNLDGASESNVKKKKGRFFM